MKARNILIVTLLLTAFSVRPLEAQRTFPLQNKASLKTEGHGAFWQSPSIGLTEAQEKELESLQQAYMAEAMSLRRELMSLRIELRHLIRDPSVQSKTLLERQKRISELQAKLDNLAFSYQMKARSILTKEQLKRLPEDCLSGMSTGHQIGIMGIGRGSRKGTQ